MSYERFYKRAFDKNRHTNGSQQDTRMTIVSSPYVLGHEERELERLASQARLLEPATRWFFQEAGLGRGMRVLDIGSGAGDVAFIVADLVGPSGEVVGSDRSAAALALARKRANARELSNVRFVECDPSVTQFGANFDAVVGRFVLMFQPDPSAMLRQLKTHVRPGGLIVFHEPAWDNVRSYPNVASFERCCAWVVEALGRTGAHANCGLMLYQAFLAAGLPAPTLRSHAVTAGGAGAEAEVRLLTELVRTMRDDIVRLGIAPASEIDSDKLTRRIIDEMTTENAVIVHRADIGASCRI